MGRSPIADTVNMVASPLHMMTASLAERLVKTSPRSSSSDKNSSNRNHGADNPVDSSDDDASLLHDESEKEESSCSSPHGAPSQETREMAVQTTHHHHGRSKSVGFADIEIRAYQVVIGDHPCCTMGCPLSLGWDYSRERMLSVDAYEASRSPRRSKEDLKTTWDERRNMVKDVPDDELKRVERKLHRERSCQRKNMTKICATFFQDVPETPQLQSP